MTILTSGPARRLLRPVATLIDQRIDRALRRHTAAAPHEASTQPDPQDARFRHALDLLLGSEGRGLARTPTAHQLARLADQITETTGAQAGHARRNTAQAFRTLVALEALGVGRIAGGTLNICGKLATVPLLRPPNGEVLEIGTLYGLFAAALTRTLQRSGLAPEVTIVDPLAGTQLQPDAAADRPDPSGTPVRRAAVLENLALAGAAGQRARIQPGFSEDPEVRAAVSDRAYGVIIIDGDHSRDGVLADLRWAEEIAAPGGVVVLDDYGDPSWPGVAEALEVHLKGESRFTLLGRVANSAFLRADSPRAD
ncbi:class I SAM-dependent methyltransferase [Streptomyces polyrhachis]|uniref:Class I SAM-dependent methyltransferase n=1 Tax=Streptomyces polyrhachis TaxID=1282885 RepID=A0ABW2GJ12_9ACTN